MIIWVCFQLLHNNPNNATFLSDVDVPLSNRKSCSKPAVEKILEFGRELYNMSQRLKLEQGKNEGNKKMLQVINVIMADLLQAN